jgi:hypothetical protein
MYQNARFLFATLDLPANPIQPSYEWPKSASTPSELRRVDDRALIPEVKSWFDQLGISVDFLMLWTWYKQPNEEFYEIHTDGDIDSYHRYCAMNWLITGNSTVSWFPFEGSTPKKRIYKTNTYPLTEWVYSHTPMPLAAWTGTRPALLNIEQPHQVKVYGDGSVPRRSVTIRFNPNLKMEEMIERCRDRIISTNRN